MSIFSSRLSRVAALWGVGLLIHFLMRLLYYFWNHATFVSQDLSKILVAFLVGFRFDAVVSAWLVVPAFLLCFVPFPRSWDRLWRWTALISFLVLLLPFIFVNFVDIEYVNYVGRRMSADMLFLVGEAQGKLDGFWDAFGLLCMIGFGFLGFGMLLPVLVLRWQPRRSTKMPSGVLARSIFAFLFMIALVIAARGGLQKKPISFVDANVFPAPLLNNLVSNSTFTVLKSIGQEKLPRVQYFGDRESMLMSLNGSVRAPSLLEGRRLKSPQNVVIMILESFGLEYMGEVNGVKGYTPFLDELVKKSLFFKNGIANGRRSIEGVAAVMSGIPAMMSEPFVTSPFAANHFVGLGTLLSEKQYDTAFFHGGNNGTMHFDSFMKSTGVERYYGAREYPDPKDHDGVWGIYDEPFMMWMSSEMSKLRQPFLTSFFSISSHQPYLIPPKDQSKYPDGPIPILKTIAYSDDSLRSFFREAEKTEWYKDTLFVITADHTFQAYLPEFNNELGRYRVPIVFFHPGFEWPKEIDRDQVVQQIDILPTVMDFLGQPEKERILLSRSVFIPGERTATIFLDGSYNLVAKDAFLHWPQDGEMQMYDVKDVNQRNPLPMTEPRAQELALRLRASIQYFSEGMWDNRLYYPTGGN